MIKVLHKAFGILEIIAENPNEPKSVKDIAEVMGLNTPTTVRILKDLASMGYVEQSGNNKGYTLGPIAFQMGSTGEYMEELLKIGKPLVKNCAESVQQSVLLSVLRKKKRLVLCHSNYSPALNIEINKLYYKDYYETATGRMGIAYLRDEELEDFVETEGLPENQWGWENVTDLQSLKSALSDIRGNGFYTGDNGSSMTVVSVPVMKNGKFVAALGASMPSFIKPSEKEEIINKVKETGKLISIGLSRAQSFG